MRWVSAWVQPWTTEWALLATFVLVGGSIVLSLLKTRGAAVEPVALPTGWVPGSPARDAEATSERD